MSIWRGAQSAIFYYLSCAPCTDARYRKKRKRQAVKDRTEKEMIEREMGGRLYRHPSPSSTNPHWQPDIAIGPVVIRKKKKRTTTDRQMADNKRLGALQSPAPGHPGGDSGSGSNLASSVDVSRQAAGNMNESKASFHHYQRDDEELWGSSVTLEPPLRTYLHGTRCSSSRLTRPDTARTKDSSASYHSYRNPPVNDRHPAVVSTLGSGEDVAWMLQPPPTLDVVSGRSLPPRSRSDSGSSRPTLSAGNVSLSRQVSNRLVAQKLQLQSTSTPSMAYEVSERAEGSAQGQRHDRIGSGATTDHRDFAETPSKRSRRRPSPIKIKSKASEDSALIVVRHPSLAAEPPNMQQTRRVASRPQLSTILSDGVLSPDTDADFYTPAQTPKENSLPNARDDTAQDSSGSYDHTARRPALLPMNSSPLPLQQPMPKTLVFNTKIFAATKPPTSRKDQRLRLPVQDGAEDHRASGGPELFDSWYSPDFELDQWVHEHTKREVRNERWSMDDAFLQDF